MNNDSGMIEIHLTSNYIIFKSNTTSLYSRLLEGTYPNVLGLIPQESKTIITMDRKRLINGIDRASLFSSEKRSNNIHLEMKEGSKMKIYSHSTEVGKIEESQNISELHGEKELCIALDGDFLMDALKVIKEDEIILKFNGTMRPILLHPKGITDQFHLISPVRTF
jgi:DNA polymerase-3 subunit beta